MRHPFAFVLQWWNKAPEGQKHVCPNTTKDQGNKQSFQIPPQYPNARRGKEL